ncbi:MAG: sigma-54-dependent Fis family transcriptional regulator [Alphaproteobacteria bacterium]|nr:sigma-54-dependent Fis family transcriptional regulator [Alphaproteobacteria bacterium]
MSALVYVLDDHEPSATALAEILEDEGYTAVVFTEPAEALAALRTRAPDVLVTDLRMDGMDGLEVQRAAAGLVPDLPVILVTGFATVDRAVQATRAGAFAFLTKPLDLDAALVQIRNAAALSRLRRAPDAAEDGIVGRSPALLAVLADADRAAPSRLPILVTGESGTGKELLARRIHGRSAVAGGPFVAVNCGAIPESLLEAELFGAARGAYTGASRDRIGLVESAHGGTLFLDEVGELSPAAQVRLLRVLQEGTLRRVGETAERRVEVRVIAATHRDLRGSDAFREDLWFRIAVVPLELPPLRDREGDVLLLLGRALRRASADVGREAPSLSSEAIDALLEYRWPGNVRELVNLADRLSVLVRGTTVSLADLPREIASSAQPEGDSRLPPGDFDLTAWLEGLEERALRRALARHEGVKARAAASLGLERNAFRYKLAKYGIG